MEVRMDIVASTSVNQYSGTRSALEGAIDPHAGVCRK